MRASVVGRSAVGSYDTVGMLMAGSIVGRSTVGSHDTIGGLLAALPARQHLGVPIFFIDGPYIEWIEPEEPGARRTDPMIEWRDG